MGAGMISDSNPKPNEPMKSIFASKTAAVGFLTSVAGIVGTFVPSVAEWTAANANVILSVLGVVAIGLRLITKDRVQLFPD
jgi:putative Mn2+ efflux pump MntP